MFNLQALVAYHLTLLIVTTMFIQMSENRYFANWKKKTRKKLSRKIASKLVVFFSFYTVAPPYFLETVL